MIEARYPYSPHIRMIGLLAGVGLVMVLAISSPPSGGEGAGFAAKILLPIVALLVLCGWSYRRENSDSRPVVPTRAAIIAPLNAVSAKRITLRYADIANMHVIGLRNNTTLRIQYAGGALGIPLGAMPDENTFKSPSHDLAARIEKAKPHA
ncbi:hypothetical protein [Pontivivens nitratireducens]|uniref:hypothetical protein n=1 Tax=Pontivivens nitratireducens TaxID=2758038 RepID=UPI00163B2A15|nr:hypothetical protein [Pontibrevibacter nitratireducens]